MLNLATILETSARDYPNNPAFVMEPHGLSYMELNALANQVANALVATGIEPGDKVALTCPNIPSFPVAYYGILKAGAAVVPLNLLLKPREILYHLTNSDAKLFLCHAGIPDLPLAQLGYEAFQQCPGCEHFWTITPPSEPSPIPDTPTLGDKMRAQPPIFETVQTCNDDTAVILYTSGTTGKPKGAELTHSNLCLNSLIGRDLCRLTPEDRALVVLPMFHSFGQTCQMNTGVFVGATSYLLPRFDPHTVLDIFVKAGITAFAGVPTMYQDLLKASDEGDHDIGAIRNTLRICVSGGSAMPMDVLNLFEERFQVPILEGYGLSETSPVATFNRLDRARKVGSVGLAVWGVEVRVVDDEMNDVAHNEPGEVVVRGHNVMKGYYKLPKANEEVFRAGWLHTGDVGKVDEDGYFYIVDRTKDMIIRNGMNVYPREVEEILMEHPAISMASVIGVPHKELGEEIKAFVVLNKDAGITEDQIRDWAKEQLASFKYPRVIEIRESLPLGPTGKILKKELRQEELAKTSGTT